MSERRDTGAEPTIHHTPAETRERNYERLRQSGGIAPDTARKIADQAARGLHDKLNRSGG